MEIDKQTIIERLQSGEPFQLFAGHSDELLMNVTLDQLTTFLRCPNTYIPSGHVEQDYTFVEVYGSHPYFDLLIGGRQYEHPHISDYPGHPLACRIPNEELLEYLGERGETIAMFAIDDDRIMKWHFIQINGCLQCSHTAVWEIMLPFPLTTIISNAFFIRVFMIKTCLGTYFTPVRWFVKDFDRERTKENIKSWNAYRQRYNAFRHPTIDIPSTIAAKRQPTATAILFSCMQHGAYWRLFLHSLLMLECELCDNIRDELLFFPKVIRECDIAEIVSLPDTFVSVVHSRYKEGILFNIEAPSLLTNIVIQCTTEIDFQWTPEGLPVSPYPIPDHLEFPPRKELQESMLHIYKNEYDSADDLPF